MPSTRLNLEETLTNKVIFVRNDNQHARLNNLLSSVRNMCAQNTLPTEFQFIKDGSDLQNKIDDKGDRVIPAVYQKQKVKIGTHTFKLKGEEKEPGGSLTLSLKAKLKEKLFRDCIGGSSTDLEEEYLSILQKHIISAEAVIDYLACFERGTFKELEEQKVNMESALQTAKEENKILVKKNQALEHSLQKTDETIQKLQKQIAHLKKNIEALKRKLKSQKDTYESTKIENQQPIQILEGKISSLKQDLNQKTEQVKQLEAELNEAHQQSSKIEQDNQSINEVYHEIEQKLSECRDELEKLRAEIGHRESEHACLEHKLEEAEKSAEEYRIKLEKAQEEKQIQYQQFTEVNHELHNELLNEQSKRLDELAKLETQYNQKMKSLKDQLSKQAQKLTKAQHLQSENDQYHLLQAEHQHLKSEHKELQKRLHQLMNQSSVDQKAISDLKEKNQELQDLLEKIEDRLKESQNRHKELECKFNTVSEELSAEQNWSRDNEKEHQRMLDRNLELTRKLRQKEIEITKLIGQLTQTVDND